MRNEYKDLGHFIGKYRCLTMKGNKDDKTLAGKLGEIWEWSPGTYKAFKRLFSKEEKIFTFKSEDLAKWVLRLKVPRKPSEQLKYANKDKN